MLAHVSTRDWGRAYGLGQPSQSAVTAAIEQQVAGAGVAVGGAAAGAAVTGASIGAAAATAAIGAGIGAVALGIILWMHRKGPAQNVATTKIANEIEPLLKQNLAAYLAGPRTRASQQVAVENFDKLWNYLRTACLNPQLGNPGKSCVDDRQQGACHFKDASGACWNWFVGYRDPIANDPQVRDTPASDAAIAGLASGSLSLPALFSGASFGTGTWLVLGAGLVAALWAFS